MKEYYIPVRCDERLPEIEKEVTYLTPYGEMCISEGKFFYFKDSSLYFPEVQPEYWLEKRQLPTKEEIEEHIPYKEGVSRHQLSQNIGFIKGAKWLLSKLK